ncbi:Translationally-controlled tumor protein -like protein [Capsicum chinense]|nr:Translationally-controlled tumor protein -like protein [Capsicum chinense]
MQQSRLSKVNIYPTTCANEIEANPSAEGGEEDEGVDDQAVKVVNVVDDFRIQSCSCDATSGNCSNPKYIFPTTLLLVEHGADIYCIDRAFAKFGMAMGPFRNDLAMVTRVMELTSENVYGTVSSAIMKLPDTNCVATGYVESETVDPSIKMGNILPGSEGSVEISQVIDNQNYKEGGTFENSNLIANIMETSSPFMERKDNESMDLGPSTMSSKGIMLEEQSVEIHVYMGDIEEILDEFMIPLNSEVNDGSIEEELGNFGKSEALVEIRIQDGHFLYPIEFVIDHALHFGVHRSLTVTEKRVALKEVFPQLMFQNSTLYSWERITIASAFETISSGDFSRR